MFLPVNFAPSAPTPGSENLPVNDQEKAGLERAAAFSVTGTPYALEQATRPSTIGHVLASNPVALLAWYVDGRFSVNG